MFIKSKLTRTLLLVVFLSLAGITPATAANKPVCRAAAVAHETGPVTLDPGKEHWYTFHSAEADPQAGSREITVVLASTPRNGLAFDVWTTDNLQRAAEGKNEGNARPVGSGTLHPIKDGDGTYDRYGGNLAWTGESGRAQTYVVQVKARGGAPAGTDLRCPGKGEGRGSGAVQPVGEWKLCPGPVRDTSRPGGQAVRGCNREQPAAAATTTTAGAATSTDGAVHLHGELLRR
jgi:hypothetical protein